MICSVCEFVSLLAALNRLSVINLSQTIIFLAETIIWNPKHMSFFFYVGFLSRTFTNHRTAGEGGGYFINSSLPLPPASQTLRHEPGNYCRKLSSAHSQQPDPNRESLVYWEIFQYGKCFYSSTIVTLSFSGKK